MGGVKTELLGGRGLRAGKDEELDRSLLSFLCVVVGADGESLSWGF